MSHRLNRAALGLVSQKRGNNKMTVEGDEKEQSYSRFTSFKMLTWPFFRFSYIQRAGFLIVT